MFTVVIDLGADGHDLALTRLFGLGDQFGQRRAKQRGVGDVIGFGLGDVALILRLQHRARGRVDLDGDLLAARDGVDLVSRGAFVVVELGLDGSAVAGGLLDARSGQVGIMA